MKLVSLYSHSNSNGSNGNNNNSNHNSLMLPPDDELGTCHASLVGPE